MPEMVEDIRSTPQYKRMKVDSPTVLANDRKQSLASHKCYKEPLSAQHEVPSAATV